MQTLCVFHRAALAHRANTGLCSSLCLVPVAFGVGLVNIVLSHLWLFQTHLPMVSLCNILSHSPSFLLFAIFIDQVSPCFCRFVFFFLISYAKKPESCSSLQLGSMQRWARGIILMCSSVSLYCIQDLSERNDFHEFQLISIFKSCVTMFPLP